jgi:hypothetical protein
VRWKKRARRGYRTDQSPINASLCTRAWQLGRGQRDASNAIAKGGVWPSRDIARATRKHARLPLTGANRFYQCFVVHTCLTTRKRTMQHFQCHYKSWRLTIKRYCTSHSESMLVFKINKSTLINATTVNEKLLDISKASLHLLKRTLFLVRDNLNLLCVNLSKEEPSCKFYIIIPRKSIYKFILGINN